MDVRAAIVQRVTERFARVRTALDRFDDASAERVMVGPKWNVRDLAGHLVFWTAEAARRLPELSAADTSPNHSQGVRATKVEARTSRVDIERTNEEVYRRNRRMSFVMLLPQLREAQERLLTALGSVRVELLTDETPVRELIDERIIRHYDHHWAGLKKVISQPRP